MKVSWKYYIVLLEYLVISAVSLYWFGFKYWFYLLMVYLVFQVLYMSMMMFFIKPLGHVVPNICKMIGVTNPSEIRFCILLRDFVLYTVCMLLPLAVKYLTRRF